MSIAEFKELVGMDIEQYESIPKDRDAFLKFYDAKDTKDLVRYYDSCSLYYNIFRKKYSFNIWWHKKGCQYPISCDSSQGEKGILTFDTPLEFTDHSDPEKLGKIIIEALDRSRKISDKVAGNPYPEKTIELLSGTTMIVPAPRDRHFSDSDDCGAAELYKAWEEQYGKAEFFEVKSAEHGIYKLRAEMKNKSVHRISYLLQIDKSELLDCTMELHKPNTRKKLDEKLTEMFEEFARKCSFKD